MSFNHLKKMLIVISCLGLTALMPFNGWAGDASLDGESVFQLQSAWTRQDGKEVKLESLKGSYVVVAMIYTSCQGACPLIVADMRKIEHFIPVKERMNVHFALFSFDPVHDTTAKLERYALAHDLDLKNWSLYRSNEGTVRELAAILGLKYKKDSDGDFEHSNLITLLDPKGRIASQLSGINKDPTTLISAIHIPWR